jgi:ACS family tartrate transporter-like MFS transporter
VFLGILAIFYLTDRPEQASWLTDAERGWLTRRLGQEESYRQQRHGLRLSLALADRRVWLLCLLYITVAMGSNSYGFYGPTIINDNFPNRPALQIGLLTAVPSLAAMVGMLLIAMHSDQTGERRWHVAGVAGLAAAGWLLVASEPSPILVLLGLTLAQVGMLSMLAPFWSLSTSFLSGTAAAAGIALINAIGNLGGFMAPTGIGIIKDETGSFSTGWLLLAAALVVGAFLAIAFRHDRTLEQRKVLSGGT